MPRVVCPLSRKVFLSIKIVTEAGEYDCEDTRVSVAIFFLPYADLQSVQSVVLARNTNCMSVIAVIFMYIGDDLLHIFCSITTNLLTQNCLIFSL